jgi:hypothetical protein
MTDKPTKAVADQRALAEIRRLRTAFHAYLTVAITVRDMNSAAWMRNFAEATNTACAAIGEPDRVEPGPGLLRVIRHG